MSKHNCKMLQTNNFYFSQLKLMLNYGQMIGHFLSLLPDFYQIFGILFNFLSFLRQRSHIRSFVILWLILGWKHIFRNFVLWFGEIIVSSFSKYKLTHWDRWVCKALPSICCRQKSSGVNNFFDGHRDRCKCLW